MKIFYPEGKSVPHLGHVVRRIEWTQEEMEFVQNEYPREGYDQDSFLERVVEKYNPSGAELFYGWMRLMQYVKDGPDSFGCITQSPQS